jgi:hypothetical protein
VVSLTASEAIVLDQFQIVTRVDIERSGHSGRPVRNAPATENARLLRFDVCQSHDLLVALVCFDDPLGEVGG